MEYEILSTITPITCNIVKTDQESHQLIYASQLYGTFFAVSAKLKLGDNKKVLEFVDLTLINYKGLYNLGLSDLTKTTWEDDKQGNMFLVLHLSAFTGTHGNDKTLRVDCQNTPIDGLKTLTVTRKLHSFGKRKDITQHLSENCFDSEFYDRDGAAIREINRMDDMSPKDMDGFEDAAFGEINSGAKVATKNVKDSDKVFKPLGSKTGKCMTAISKFV